MIHCRFTARRSWVRFPHGALLALGGRSSPGLQCSGVLSPVPFCVEFACSPCVHKGFPPQKNMTLDCPSSRAAFMRPETKSSDPSVLVRDRVLFFCMFFWMGKCRGKIHCDHFGVCVCVPIYVHAGGVCVLRVTQVCVCVCV